MVKKERGVCLTCKRTTSSRWFNMPRELEPFVLPNISTNFLRRRKICALCSVRKPKKGGPMVKRSNIRGAGNGLFADRDYTWGETVAFYKGVVHADKTTLSKNSSYVLQRCGFYIDGKSGFEDGLGRYINGTRGGQKPNVYMGYPKLGFDVPIRVLTKAMAKAKGIPITSPFGLRRGEEMLVSYGSGYWRAKSRK